MKKSKPPLGKMMFLVPPVGPPPKGLKEMPLESNLDIINEHYALLKEKDKYGKD